MNCPICEKRKAERFCPAKGERICAVCCGTEREVTLDCPSDCSYLISAHRYEDQHRKPLSAGEIPFPDVELSPDLIHEQRPLLSGLGFALLQFAAEQKTLNDADALAALAALAETYRTLGSGLYYEKLPDAPLPNLLYGELAKFIAAFKKQDAERTGFTRVKDTEIFHLLVFLLRVGKQQTSGRPRSKRFLDFLRAQYPNSANEPETPRIILP